MTNMIKFITKLGVKRVINRGELSGTGCVFHDLYLWLVFVIISIHGEGFGACHVCFENAIVNVCVRVRRDFECSACATPTCLRRYTCKRCDFTPCPHAMCVSKRDTCFTSHVSRLSKRGRTKLGVDSCVSVSLLSPCRWSTSWLT